MMVNHDFLSERGSNTVERGYNRHHCLWARNHYKTSLEKALRNHDGLVVPLLVPIHRELHAHIDPPPKPDKRLIMGSLEFLDDLLLSTLTNEPDTIRAYSEYLFEQKMGLATRIGKNLVRQLVYIDRGYYNAD